LFRRYDVCMEGSESVPLSGRRAQAARNDVSILEAARAVFVADPEAPISAVAEHAGVGISAVYRRYENKEELLRRLCADGLARYVAAAEDAVADGGDPWSAFTEFARRIVDADTHALTTRLAGTFEPTDELRRDATRANELTAQLVERAQAAGALRPDLETQDLSCVFEQLSALRLGDEERTRELRRRYLALQLDALHGSRLGDLPGRAPSWQELSQRWER
jgi:AcrR family transcriptional regulator